MPKITDSSYPLVTTLDSDDIALVVEDGAVKRANQAAMQAWVAGLPAASVAYSGSTNIVAANVEAALDELDTEKVQNVLGVAGIWTGNQAAYDALGTWSSTTLYIIT